MESTDELKQPQEGGVSWIHRLRFRLNPLRTVGIVAFCLLLFSVFFPEYSILKNLPLIDLASENDLNQDLIEKGFNFSQLHDKLLGGLLPPGLEESSCLSRYRLYLHCKGKPRHPSSHLISRLRSYEALHKQCGPGTDSYREALKNLKQGGAIDTNSSACQYVVWITRAGLGNRMLTLASAFLYALLTNRVLLIGHGGTVPDLFCEPFPEASWLLPSRFPIGDQFSKLDAKYPHSFGNMLRSNAIGNTSMPTFVYIHLVSDYDDDDKRFFCDQDQKLLQNVPWLIMKSDLYFVPSLFLMPSFQEELSNLFPEKETVFHHLGRYLFHPSNHVWGLIAKNYNAYLAKADEKLGIQLRFIPYAFSGSHKQVLDQILACTVKEKLLPEINKSGFPIKQSRKNRTIDVLLTSLKSGYDEELQNVYSHHATITGEVVTVHQPSHEKHQRKGNEMHDSKALAEIYLLSLSDNLVTSPWSTFGYVAQSLAGLRPWIFYNPSNGKPDDPACHLASSMEPCFQIAPVIHPSRRDKGVGTANMVSYVRHCEDVGIGLKLFDEYH